MAEYRLLGPVEIRAGGRAIDVGQPRQRAVLAALLVDAGQVVSWDVLINRVWGDAPPANPRASLRVYAAGIRRALEGIAVPDGRAPLFHRGGGYLLDIDRDQVDLYQFRQLVQGGQTANGTTRAALLRRAVALWRGSALGGLDASWADRIRQHWNQERLDAVVAWAHAELAVGNPADVVAPLTELADEYPMAESVAAVLMRALPAVGRPADGLDHYARFRTRLSDELGIDPGPEVQTLFQALLRGELRPAAGATSTANVTPPGSPSRHPKPAQLPAELPSFVGRTEHLARLDALLAMGGAPGPTMVAVLAGGPAVGKTALAVHWAHRVADRFPDGQIYLNLRGFGPDGRPLTTGEAIGRLLEALGWPLTQLPTDSEARACLYRTVLAGQRVLVVLDNARNAGQVRPLLPGAPGCLVIVTSRNQLTGLVAAQGAHLIGLEVPSTGEAWRHLVARLGHDRVAAEPEAADDIITRCAGLPLALAVVAARAATGPGTLRDVADEVGDAGRALDALDGGDATTDVRTVFSWSYAALTSAAGRLFTLLGLHPGPDTSLPAAASLAGARPAGVQPLLGELCDANLLVEHRPGRYTCHDLLRAYAADQASTLADGERRTAIRRLLDHYLHTADSAAHQLNRARDPLVLTPPAPGTTVEHPADPAQALEWFAAENAVLLGAIDLGVQANFDTHACDLAWTVYDYLDRQGQRQDQIAVQRAAVVAAHKLGDLRALGRAARYLANGYAGYSAQRPRPARCTDGTP